MKNLPAPNPQPPPPQARDLLRWYDRHARRLPWRMLKGASADPYRVWLSEIMLQQTVVATVIPYFDKFIERWPTVQALAKASRDEVLQAWAGLGYYRRARGLHDCAQLIVNQHGGIFPAIEAKLLQLPGFGPYTAAAVAAIAYGQRANVVDGNVERVIARLFAVTAPLPQAKAELRQKAATLLPGKRYGDYAQALMDLGATICTPRNPKCILCPWRDACTAFRLGVMNELPRRAAKTARPIRRAVAFVLFNQQGEIFLRRRADQGLLAGMMEIPSSAWLAQELPDLKAVQGEAPLKGIKWRLLPATVTHVFTHFTLELAVAVGRTTKTTAGVWVAPKRLKEQALPSLMHKVVQFAQKA